MKSKMPLLVTIPHSGEKVPELTPWLKQLPEEVLMCDVDRYVDLLYAPALEKLKIDSVKTEWHRYAADLNRVPEDVDASSVVGHMNPAGMHSRGFHWVITTYKHSLMTEPMSLESHNKLVELVYEPFHASVRREIDKLKSLGYQKTFHIDAHSMPSVGTSEHRDPGERRADIVVSDSKGKSCDPRFKDLVIAAYVTAGFKVGYNWPYFGGRVTEVYGQPNREQHCLQVELNRSLYMDEVTKKLDTSKLEKVQAQISQALEYVYKGLPGLL